MNEAVISWHLLPGDYTLWLYEVYNQTDKSVLGCVPFTLSLTITPIEENENLLNCKGTLINDCVLLAYSYLHFFVI